MLGKLVCNDEDVAVVSSDPPVSGDVGGVDPDCEDPEGKTDEESVAAAASAPKAVLAGSADAEDSVSCAFAECEEVAVVDVRAE